MPNHEDNYVTIIGKPADIRLFIDECLVDGDPEKNQPEKVIDFQRIIPMPDGFHDTVSPHEIVDTQEEADRLNAEYNAQPYARVFREEGSAPQVKYMTREEEQRRLTQYGALDWYDWAIKNWGTKWGAYEHTHYELRWLQTYDSEPIVYGRVDLTFQTAWSQPAPIFQEIEKEYNVKVHAVTQDEGGFPDVTYGDPYDEEVIRKVISFEFDSYHQTADEPVAAE